MEGHKPLVSIVLMAYDHLEYTRLCIESLYRYTSHIDFELIAVNDGSSDGTREYLNSLTDIKRIDFNQNTRTTVAFNEGLKLVEGELILFTAGTAILTPNWLNNLLTCISSDENIGMVVPASNLDLNHQQSKLIYNSLEEMYQITESYNTSDINKWEERLKLSVYTCLTRTDLLKKLGGFDESYNLHSFEDDDLSFRMRRAGFKLIFAGDTFIHHFESADYTNDALVCSKSLNVDSKIFYTKFHVDALTDTRIDFEVLSLIDFNNAKDINILCIGSCCGATILHVKNQFRRKGITNFGLWYLTEDERYIPDLESVCDHVVYACTGDVSSLFGGQKFDCIILETEIQSFQTPEILIKNIKNILKDNGQIVFSLVNQSYYANVLDLINVRSSCEMSENTKSCLSLEKLIKLLKKHGYDEIKSYYLMNSEIPEEHKALVESLKSFSNLENKETLNAILCSRSIIFSAKGKTGLKSVLFYPGYDFWLDDLYFELDVYRDQLGVYVGKPPFAILRDELNKLGYRFCTIDNGDMEEADYIMFIDVPKSYNNRFFRHLYHSVYRGKVFLEEALRQKKKRNVKLILFMQEPMFVMPENYDRNIHEHFDAIITFDDDIVDNKKYFKYNTPEPAGVQNKYSKSFRQKKLLTLIDSKKYSNVSGELYSKRREAIRYFEKNHIDSFDFYGHGWENSGYDSYKGSVPGKLEILSQYKFCICYENGILNGWITEKIFDCFFSGCVPIYLGAPNVTDYIPGDTFIDKRKFEDYGELYDFISSIDEKEYNVYLKHIRDFLNSDMAKRFSYASFTQTLMDILAGSSANMDGS